MKITSATVELCTHESWVIRDGEKVYFVSDYTSSKGEPLYSSVEHRGEPVTNSRVLENISIAITKYKQNEQVLTDTI
jgi:hypothetical protein